MLQESEEMNDQFPFLSILGSVDVFHNPSVEELIINHLETSSIDLRILFD